MAPGPDTTMGTVRRRWAPLLSVAAAALVGSVVLAACGSSPSATSSTTKGTSKPAAATSTTAPPANTPVYEVRTGKVPGLGTVLVDGQGLTLYMFVPDKQTGISTCYGACAQAWPPLVLPTGASAPAAGPGVKSSLLGVTKRNDGTTQITYNKWPLYTWVSDSAPGQATGQALNNLGGLWYVLSPSGQEITTKI